ncbi:MAG: glycerophosphodiester phosphodiesterase [Polyangiaceae bacterium]|nr:glycerophosphodiester phosphodiesterase [Polyangiaceae bacterium]
MQPRPERLVLRAPHPLTFAHRGGAGQWPENTLLAFERAISLGVDFIETDVRLTRDGELVLCHDATVDRTTNGHGAIERLDLDELRRFDAGWRFTRDGSTFPFRGQGLRVPTLAEALALDPRVRFNLDLKSTDPAAVGRLIDAMELGGYGDRLVVASHSQAMIRCFRSGCGGRVATAAGPHEVMAFLAAARVRMSHHLRCEYDALQVPRQRALIHVVDRRFVTAAHELNLPVHVFTIDTPETMRELLALGVDGLMTNRPDRLLPIARRHAALGSPLAQVPTNGATLGRSSPVSGSSASPR